MVAAGDRLGGHLPVERVLVKGDGGVWVARTSDGDQVFLEAMPLTGGSAADTTETLTRMRPAVVGVVHHNVLPVVDVGVDDNHIWVTSAFIEGAFLSNLIRSARDAGVGASPGVAGGIARQVARALGVLHSAADTDDKPRGRRPHPLDADAVFVTRGGVVQLTSLVPFGPNQADPNYLSPEVASGKAGDGRSDFFGLGSILWTMLTGRPLFPGTSRAAVLDAVRATEIPRLPAYVPARLAGVTMRCLARDPAERFDSAALLEAALEAATIDQPDADRVGLSAYLTDLEAAEPRDPKRRTFQLSASSQSGAPRTAHKTEPSGPPTAAVWNGPDNNASEPDRASPVNDDFFDVDRDGGGISNPRFEVLGRLGSGGMGEVYRVRDHELNEVVALKLIPAHAASEMHSVERLKREVRLARRIASENVCRIFDLVDLGHGSRGLTMAMISGTTLAELMKTRLQVDYVRFAKWAADVANGLAAAHAVDIIHRDLKPENVMITDDDRAVILDFGIARSQADTTEIDGKLTQAGIIMGTPLYMSPEQLANRELDGRSDLYALGLLLGELITSEVPIPGEGYSEILDRRVIKASENRYRLLEIDPGCPAGLAGIVDQLVQAAAADRPADAGTAERLLRQFINGETIDIVVPAARPTEDQRAPAEAVRTDRPAAAKSPQSKWLGGIALLAALVIILTVWVARDPRPSVADPLVRNPTVGPAGLTDAGTIDGGRRDGGPRDSGPRDSGPRRTRPPAEEM